MSKAIVSAIIKALQCEPLSDEEKVLCNEFRLECKEYSRIANDKKRIEAGWQKVKQELNRQGLLDG